jgi:hypothetical protein
MFVARGGGILLLLSLRLGGGVGRHGGIGEERKGQVKGGGGTGTIAIGWRVCIIEGKDYFAAEMCTVEGRRGDD